MSGSVLVTGGGGRLGRQLQAAGGGSAVGLRRADLDIADISSVAQALDRVRPSLVVNPAAVSSLEAAASDPQRARAVNAIAPGLLAEACRDRGVPLIHVSTDYVFGAETDRPWREDDPVSPVNAYGEMKAEGERRVLGSGVRGCVVRVAWLFGDGGDFLVQMIRRGLETGAVTVAQDQIGSPTPIGPLAAAILRLGERLIRPSEAIPPILHMAGSPPVARADWVETAFDGLRAAGRPAPQLVRAPMASFPSSVARPRFSALDSTLLRDRFGEAFDWRPTARAVGVDYATGAGAPIGRMPSADKSA